jgi:uncharacterized protein
MSEDVLVETIRQVMSQSGEQVFFSWQGGEPTLMGLSFFEKAVELEKKYGQGRVVGNGFQTNGILLDEKWIRFLREYKFLVGLSLDGPGHVHDRYRLLKDGSGSWLKAVDSAKRLLDGGVAVNALSVVNDYSVNYPEDIYNFHKELGLKYMQFIPCVEPISVDNNKAEPFSVPAEDYGNFLCALFDQWFADFENSRPTTSVRFFESVLFSYAGLNPPECTLLKDCGVYVVVEHNGDVYSCDFFVESPWKLGNVLDGKITDMLNSDRQREFGRQKSILPQPCRECQWLKSCRGGCTKDRIGDSKNKNLNFLCRSFKMFFEYTDYRFKQLAQQWKNQQAQIQEKEYVNKFISRMSTRKKVGRNDPCSCGSGLKYKKCCGII